MAKILAFYSLCPLIEQKSFLGLTKDADADTVLVTANNNIIGRYKVSDPKLISSWNSKGSITAAAVYNAFSQQYVAIFNYNEVRMWTANDESIDKIKKYKFAEKLHRLVVSPENGKVLVVFTNGNVSFLENAIENRKNVSEKVVITGEEKIVFSETVHLSNTLVTILLVCKSDKSYRVLGVVPEQPTSIIFDTAINVSENTTLLGYCLLIDKECYLISLWSDGKLYRDSLFPSSSTVPNHCVDTLDNIDLNQSVIVQMLSPYSIAICGSKDDGILLMIYSVKYNLIQCQQFYENCNTSSKLWIFESKLFLIMGHNLVVIPYVQENRKLSSLIGSSSHQLDTANTDILPESEICKSALSKVFENNDTSSVLDIINFNCDIPDSALIDVLLWSLKSEVPNLEILDIILRNHSVSDICKLRTMFTIDLSLYLLDYIMSHLNESNFNVKLIKWASLLVDAFYPQFIMTNDETVLNKFKSYLTILKKECDFLNEYKEFASIVSLRNKQV